MSLGFSRLGLTISLAAFATSTLFVSNGFAQGKAQPRRSIELSETNSAEILTNLSQFSTKKDEFRQLDEQLRGLKGLSTPKSLAPGFSLPYSAPTALPNKRIKDLIERKKNWNLTAEDMNLQGRSSDAEVSSFEGTDKLGDKDASLRQFYNALNRSSKGGPNPNRSTSDRSISNQRSIYTQENASEDDSSLPPEIRDKTEQLRNLVNGDPTSIFNPARARSSFQNFFGASATVASPTTAAGQAQGQKNPTWLNQFQNILDSSVAAGLDPAVSALAPDANSNRKTISPELTKLPSTSHRDTSEAPPARPNSVLDVTSVSDLNAPVLNQWNPLYTPPKIQLPKFTPPTPPNLDFPRRKF